MRCEDESLATHYQRYRNLARWWIGTYGLALELPEAGLTT
jgi:hypothetical protein